MKKLIAASMIGLAFFACKQNPENGGEEIRGNEQRSDTPMNISSYPGEGASDSNGMHTNNASSDQPGRGERDFKGTPQDSQKTHANPLYKGDNSDTGKRKR